ncbi:type I-E CRISPR-associated protein Cse2/CasB [Saccharothrix longispora]|uniref:CRISPR system Cascade subunit CasB n=1 Tax=Saccharothrix longispora TaxID=33920 RepID=A0ABU1PV81_9PSEU|nr:type I-E CRISPR-associated protein Cse2/CasB [Saccharothrix longispora]MDR6594529.1 CRISPR system Cascade subunit CasB [Saccharothrix longispora]
MTDNRLRQRRRAFTGYLYGLHQGLSSDNGAKAAESRRVLARLRRTFSGPRQEAEAYEYVFKHDPPHSEEEAWLLLAGLFALHPQPRRDPSRRGSLGGSMGELEARRGFAATRRFTDLVARDRDGLPHHLRQTIRLLASHDITVNYDQLLDDLVILLGDDHREQHAHSVRLRWAREFHRPSPEQVARTTTGTTDTAGDASDDAPDGGPEEDSAQDDYATTENS